MHYLLEYRDYECIEVSGCEQTSENDAGSGFPGEPDTADQIGKHIGDDRRNAADHDDAQRVLPGLPVGVFSCAQKFQQRAHEDRDAGSKYCGDKERQV